LLCGGLLLHSSGFLLDGISALSFDNLLALNRTISPEAVSPIGMQPPGGASSFTEGSGAGLGFTVPVV
jgi:hypothetical protein